MGCGGILPQEMFVRSEDSLVGNKAGESEGH